MNRIATLLLTLSLLACTNSSEKQTTDENTTPVEKSNEKQWIALYIKTVSVDGDIKRDTITTIESDYFEVSLRSVDKGRYFIAQRDIERVEPGKKFKMIFFSITDSKGEIMEFKSSTDFLNYMSSVGYDMMEQDKAKYRTDYTFKKKI